MIRLLLMGLFSHNPTAIVHDDLFVIIREYEIVSVDVRLCTKASLKRIV